jgi:hypothetical protein
LLNVCHELKKALPHIADNKEVVFNMKGLEAEASFDLFRKEVFLIIRNIHVF